MGNAIEAERKEEIIFRKTLDQQLAQAETTRSQAAGGEKKALEGLMEAARLAAESFDGNEKAKKEGRLSVEDEDFSLAQLGLYNILGMAAADVVEHSKDAGRKKEYKERVEEYKKKAEPYRERCEEIHRTFHGTPVYWPGELVRIEAKALRGTGRYQEAVDLLTETYRQGQAYLRKETNLSKKERLGIKGSLGLCLLDRARAEVRGGIKGRFEALPDFLKGASQAADTALQMRNTARIEDLVKITAQFILEGK